VPADGDHLVGQDAGAMLLHGQERQVQAFEFFLDRGQRFALRGVFGKSFQFFAHCLEAGVEIFAHPTDGRADV